MVLPGVVSLDHGKWVMVAACLSQLWGDIRPVTASKHIPPQRGSETRGRLLFVN